MYMQYWHLPCLYSRFWVSLPGGTPGHLKAQSSSTKLYFPIEIDYPGDRYQLWSYTANLHFLIPFCFLFALSYGIFLLDWFSESSLVYSPCYRLPSFITFGLSCCNKYCYNWFRNISFSYPDPFCISARRDLLKIQIDCVIFLQSSFHDLLPWLAFKALHRKADLPCTHCLPSYWLNLTQLLLL